MPNKQRNEGNGPLRHCPALWWAFIIYLQYELFIFKPGYLQGKERKPTFKTSQAVDNPPETGIKKDIFLKKRRNKELAP